MAAGDLDPHFGGDGIANAAFPTSDGGEAVAVQADGKVVVAGSTSATTPNAPLDFALTRFNADGTLDTTFGTGGLVRTDMGFDDIDFTVLLQGSKILVGGRSGELFSSNNFDFAMARYTADGRLDPTFGNGGKVITEFAPRDPTEIYSMALQPDGKIVAVGDLFHIGDNSDDSVAVARYFPNGQLDTDFGFGGFATYQIANASGSPKPTLGKDVAILPDGGILIAADGTDSTSLERPTIALLRLTPDGFPDETFGDGSGARVYEVGFFQTSRLEVTPAADAVYVAGMSTVDGTRARVYRFTVDGDPDTGYGSGGHVDVTTDGNPYVEVATALQPDGKLVVGAETPGEHEVWGSWTIARLTTDGAFDPTFGDGGRVTITMGEPDFANIGDLALAPDGKIVAAGTALFPDSDYDMVAARFIGGVPPPVERVSGALVSGVAWTEPFKRNLSNLGFGPDGVSLSTLSATSPPLPWSNIDRVTVHFTGDVAVTSGDLTLRGVRVAQYSIRQFVYDPVSWTATWTLASPIRDDRVHATVSADVVVGGYQADFSVLPGDVTRNGRVDAADLARVRTRLGSSVSPFGVGRANYDATADSNGSGVIDVLDLAAVRRDYGAVLPAAQAATTAAAWLEASTAERGMPRRRDVLMAAGS